MKRLIIFLIIITVLGLGAWGSFVYVKPLLTKEFEPATSSTSSTTPVIVATSSDTTTLETVNPTECDLILTGSSTAKEIGLPITCRAEIGKGEELVDIVFLAENTRGEGKGSYSYGKILIKRGNKEIFSLGNDELTIEIVPYLTEGEKPILRNGSFELKDVTFDGYKDIRVLTISGAYNFSFDYYAYNPVTHTFNSESILHVVNGGVDTDKKTASSFSKGRGLGDLYIEEFYEFRNGKYVLVKSEEQNMVDVTKENSDYVRITKELKDGEMVETKREIILYKEIGKEYRGY